MVVTKGGLVFQAGGDGKFRAYDEDTGKVLWFAPFVGSAPGVPVSYESKGRQYVAMIASHGGGGAPGTDTTPASGMIAFAVKRR
jgi:glucose dehydrogenase